MPRTYPTIDGGESSCFLTPQGGVISLTGDTPRIAGLERITTTPRGVAFGPLQISTPAETDAETDEDTDTETAEDEHTVAAVENLRFAPTQSGDDSLLSWGDDDGNETTTGLLGLAIGGTAATSDDVQVTRRQTIGVLAGALALGGTAATASAQEPEQIKFAEFDLARADGPVHVSVLDIVDNALPAGTELTLAVDGAQRHEWTPTDDSNGETVVLEDSPKRVKVYAEGGVGQVKALMAWAKGILASGDEIKATLELPKAPTDMEEGDAVMIDDHPAFVETVRRDEGEESIVTVGGESIPHDEERWGRELGYYRVSEDDALEYVCGTDPPDGTIVELRLRAGRIASMTDSIERL
ncbi:hypothetical protein [Natrinema sp. DC36]|uniref:hypothetical protein n=1 Tax=Natrinema sp. DC36 TaxID=2878680 RepID=UPI001CEFE077|nr:hypothetical protein [Natrinema sp. DC36]